MPPPTNTLLRRLLWAIEQGNRAHLMAACNDVLKHLEQDGEMPDPYLFHRLLGELLATVPDRLFRQEMGRQAGELARIPADMLREAKAARIPKHDAATRQADYRKRKRKRAAGVKPATE